MVFFDDSSSDDHAVLLSDFDPVASTEPVAPEQLAQRPSSRRAKSALSIYKHQAEPMVQFRRRDVLTIDQGQLWDIQQGFVKTLTWDEQGCVITLGIWGPGESVGLPLGEIDPYQVVCVTPVLAKSRRLKSGYPYEFLWNQAQQTQELFSLFRCRCLETRLMDLLWWLAGRFGQTVPKGRMVGVPLTHQELANLLGSTRVTMTRLLRQLREAGKLEQTDRREFLLKDGAKTPGVGVKMLVR